MTKDEINALKPHPGWSDGRWGYLWCWFDALIDEERRIRAEITFDDDDEGNPSSFFDPELFIETNRDATPDDKILHLITWDGVVVKLTEEEVVRLIEEDPTRILEEYADQVAKLDIWNPEKGYRDEYAPIKKGRSHE